MKHQTSSRRRFLQSAGVASTIIIAGCAGASDGTDAPEQTDTEAETNVEADTDTPEDDSVFEDYGVSGTRLSVQLTADALGQVAQIRLETPSGENATEVGDTITQYSFDILRERAGTWFIDALDSNGNPIETVELETTFGISTGEIGTLAQLGITGDSTTKEEIDWQVELTNTGDVPVEPRRIQMNIPAFDASLDYFGDEGYSGEMGVYRTGEIVGDQYGGLVDRDEEFVIAAGEDNTYRYDSRLRSASLLVFREEEAEQIAGQSFQGELIINYMAEREETVVPITVEMGDRWVSFSTVAGYLEGTEISLR